MQNASDRLRATEAPGSQVSLGPVWLTPIGGVGDTLDRNALRVLAGADIRLSAGGRPYPVETTDAGELSRHNSLIPPHELEFNGDISTGGRLTSVSAGGPRHWGWGGC